MRNTCNILESIKILPIFKYTYKNIIVLSQKLHINFQNEYLYTMINEKHRKKMKWYGSEWSHNAPKYQNMTKFCHLL